MKVDSCLVTVSIDRRQLPIALLGWYHPCKIGFNGGIGFEIEIFHQHVEHGGRYECREFGPERDVFYTEGKEREQDEHRLLLIPRDVVRDGNSLMPTPNAFASACAITTSE